MTESSIPHQPPVEHIVHVVCTDAFAGTERYVLNAALAMRSQGMRVSVIGGAEVAMRLPLERAGAVWMSGSTVTRAMRSLRRVRAPAVLVSHMTAADLAAVIVGARRKVPVVSVRHFAATRGSGPLARRLGAWMLPRFAGQLAGSEFVAARIDGASVVVPPGVHRVDDDGARRGSIVLVAQRLEREKRTDVALRAWAGVEDHRGWRLVVAGAGGQRDALEALAEQLGVSDQVEFLGFVDDVDALLRRSGIFLATAPAEPFGLSVVEAMAHGLPIVAAAGGGHIETVGALEQAQLFPPDDVASAAARLGHLIADDLERGRYGESLRIRQRTEFDFSIQGDRILYMILSFAHQWRSSRVRMTS